ncbi:hypothetical protein C8R47DRAFT_1229631 [Mycena vitilis]|nr:hypothetical protein C8R47DRAFT_1229631 [Mycena vitilis]
MAALRELPTLTSLLIEDSRSTKEDISDLMEAMTVTGTSAGICPRLTSMTLGPGKYFPLDLLFTMALSRFQASSPNSCLEHLRLFTLRNPHPSWNEVHTPIRKLRDEGYDAAILNESEAQLVTTQGFVWDNNCK